MLQLKVNNVADVFFHAFCIFQRIFRLVFSMFVIAQLANISINFIARSCSEKQNNWIKCQPKCEKCKQSAFCSNTVPL